MSFIAAFMRHLYTCRAFAEERENENSCSLVSYIRKLTLIAFCLTN